MSESEEDDEDIYTVDEAAFQRLRQGPVNDVM